MGETPRTTRTRHLAAGGALTATLLAALCASLRGDDGGPSAPLATKPSASGIERAVNAVYPALVYIDVIVAQHEGGRERKAHGVGSGAIISPEGYVVTNHHVAGDAVAILCRLASREELRATLVGTDPLADIAVVKLDLSSRRAGAGALPVARFGSSAALRVGDPVLAMGCPLALSQSVTKGIVANKDMTLPRFFSAQFLLAGEDVGSVVKWIGHDAVIQPGNSGGPLVNGEGEIVGINEIGCGAMGGAIPSDLAREVAREIIERGKVRRSWIGADLQPLLKTSGAASGDAAGVLVSGVIAGSPAERAGLRAGDVIATLDGAPIRASFAEDLPAVNALLLSRPAEQSLSLGVRRGAEQLVLSVKPEAREGALGKEREAPEWGLTVREMTTISAKEMQRRDRNGAIVGTVRPGGPSDQAQPALLPQDVIVEVAGKPVLDLESFREITRSIAGPKPVPTLVAFERQGQRFLTLVEVGLKAPREAAHEVQKAWLPVATQVLSRRLAAALGLKGKKGVRIAQVYPESSAEAAGLQVGDVLTHLDGVAIDASEPQDADVLNAMVRAYRVGTRAELTVLRNGETLKVSCVLDEGPRPEQELVVYEDPVLELKARDLSYLDRVSRQWSKSVRGALVTQVEAGGWAQVGGLQAGDVVQEVDGSAVGSVKELEARLKSVRSARPRHLALLVRRGIHTLFVELEPRWPDAR